MLDWNFVLERIKEELSFPFQVLEKSDEDIIDYCKRNSLKKFTKYIPDTNRITVNFSDEDIKVPGRQSEIYIIDPDDRDVLNIKRFYPTLGTQLLNNHPYWGAYSFGELEEWALQQHNAGVLNTFSNYNYTFEFMPPNMMRVSPKFTGSATIEYERDHDPELSTIYPDLHDDFVDLCMGMVFMMIGRIRQKFNSYNTPVGQIEVNGDIVYNEGKEIYDRIIEKFERRALLNVTFDHG